jgi:CheY-like chemotaxis protein
MRNNPILLVEDEEHDVIFMQMALQSAKVRNPLAVAYDGHQALCYLEGQGEFANRRRHPLPRLVLLDLRLPRLPGLDVLKWIREQPHFRQLPVIVLSTSNQDSDIEQAYRFGANAYIVKPAYPELLVIVKLIKTY